MGVIKEKETVVFMIIDFAGYPGKERAFSDWSFENKVMPYRTLRTGGGFHVAMWHPEDVDTVSAYLSQEDAEAK